MEDSETFTMVESICVMNGAKITTPMVFQAWGLNPGGRAVM
jgi:hypothetical protein